MAYNSDLLSNSKAFCMMPWVHLHVDTRGQAQACCVGNIPFGNINEQSISEIWQGQPIREFRWKMMKDEQDSRCRVCYAREAAGAVSMREEVNRDYAHRFDTVMTTWTDGTAPMAKPVYWDIRFSNLCNFRCRTCWHGASSRWFEEAKVLGNAAGPEAVIQAAKEPKKLMRQLELMLPQVEEIYFAGGEPLLMAEHFALLQALLKLGRREVRLRYNTNFSRLNFGGNDLLAMWREFENVVVGASLDAMGKRGEFLRKEQRWEVVEANRQRLLEECPKVRFEVQPTVSVFNVLHLLDFHREWVEKGWLDLDGMVPNLLERPDYYNIKVLPRAVKEKVQARFAMHGDWMKGEGASAATVERFQSIIDFMNAAEWQSKLPKFHAASEKLDEMRGENWREIFPELDI
jgi:radical SAM protein with 4Fe4S-binding SPASM domain